MSHWSVLLDQLLKNEGSKIKKLKSDLSFSMNKTYLGHWKVLLNKLLDLVNVDLLNITFTEQTTEQSLTENWEQSVDKGVNKIDSLNITLAEQTEQSLSEDWNNNADEGINNISSWQVWQQVDDWAKFLGDG